MRKWLKNLRVNKGISQQEMAVKLEIAPSYYSMIESGERQKDLDLSIVTRLAYGENGGQEGRYYQGAVQRNNWRGIFREKCLTNAEMCCIIKLKARLQTVMPKSVFLKNNAALAGWRYFFMVNATNSNRIIINDIM